MGKKTIGLMLGLCALCAATQASAANNGALTLTIENDAFTGSDNNYSNGLGLTWVSGAVDQADEGAIGRWSRFWSFLPYVGDEGSTTFASWGMAQEMNTPDDIKDPNPSPDDQPYSGILYVDSTLYARNGNSMHAWQLKLGVVGPASRADDAQRGFHRVIGSDEPRGWHTQLPNEPIVNLTYSVAHRAAGGPAGESMTWRLVPVATVGVGNYFTGVGVGAYGEIGWNLVDALGVTALRSGLNAASTVGVGPVDRWSVSFFGGIGAYAVSHFLPLDGTMFRDSRSVPTKPLTGMTSGGVCVRREGLTLSLAWTRSFSTFDTERRKTDFGTLGVSWSL